MADTILKSKAQLRSVNNTTTNGNSSSTSGDKTPTTPSKLMINHGKPNFTIQRSPQAQQNGEDNPLTHDFQANKNNNYNPYKKAESQSYNKSNNNNIIISTKFNGAFRPGTLPLTQKQPHQMMKNGNDENENEATMVVLRRTKAVEPLPKDNNEADDDDDAVPEFIKRQRRIQERLAKENILDFENRRSGYFTHVVITPTSPNRQSLVETMTSPAVVPALEMPPPTPQTQQQQEQQAVVVSTMLEESIDEETKEEEKQIKEEEEKEKNAATTNEHAANTNGHSETNDHHQTVQAEKEAVAAKEDEEEVAKAIEEVNKAVAGEDDEKLNSEQSSQTEQVEKQAHAQTKAEEQHEIQNEVTANVPVMPVSPTWHPIEPPAEFKNQIQSAENLVAAETVDLPAVVGAVATMEITDPVPVVEEKTTTSSPPPSTPSNGHIEVAEVHAAPKDNGHGHGHDSDVTISHTNGFDGHGPNIAAPDPSGALGVNYEPKTVVSFSKDLSSEPNKYPDAVKVTTENGDAAGGKTPIDEDLQDIAKVKFDIKADEQDVKVTPVLRAD